MSFSLPALRAALHREASPEDAAALRLFFKTGPGQYGEDDVFIGVKVPTLRRLALQGGELYIPALERLLHSKIHEERALALFILVRRFERGAPKGQKACVDAYLRNTRWINNWDLVDLSCYKILGPWLLDKPRSPLYRLAKSPSLWERRIAVVTTLAFIRQGELADTFALCKHLLGDPEDLLHKACGWMLREAGKRDGRALLSFLDLHAPRMPRTMLRYAIEKLPPKQRRRYLDMPRGELQASKRKAAI
jgi:3-methyladenine DNA glycosylase AlkD